MTALILEPQTVIERLYRIFFTSQKYEVIPTEQVILDHGT